MAVSFPGDRYDRLPLRFAHIYEFPRFFVKLLRGVVNAFHDPNNDTSDVLNFEMDSFVSGKYSSDCSLEEASVLSVAEIAVGVLFSGDACLCVVDVCDFIPDSLSQ